ncbi:MAG: hypothetical protein BWY68_00885 [bacterium ADurb.Bin400]|nr:MAG: hypothetical protein BWY68_00885 [bacterium ADurb.Bin400]
MANQLALLNEPAIKAQDWIVAQFTTELPKPHGKESGNKQIGEALKTIFPTEKEESWLKRARRILGEIAVGLSDSELETYLTEFEFLLDGWIDEFEKQLFDNRTLREVLREG